jgi:hypothetical protein
MKRSTLTAFALCLGLLLTTAVGPAVAKDKNAKKAGQLTGTVHMINKDTSTITIQKGTQMREVVFNSDTKFLQGTQSDNKPSSLDTLKEGWYINCKGNYEGVKLVAAACRFRENK